MGAIESVLKVESVTARYGKAVAIQDLSLTVQEGEVVALLGANGSGKTTLLNTISGFIRPASGQIDFQNQQISGLEPHRIVRLGVVQVSQNRDLFGDMSVLDNLELGATTARGDTARDLGQVFAYFPRLHERRDQKVRTLSGGEQQMVALGRALMSKPQILMLDEPSGGLAPRFVDEIANIVQVLKSEGKTMLLVEQNMALALGAADRCYVLRDGKIVRSADVKEFSGVDHRELAKAFYL